MVLPLGLLLSNPPQYASLYEHLKSIIDAAAPVPVKVILETSLIQPPLLKIAAAVISSEAGAAFVKTSTGFAGGGATKEDVGLLYRAVKYKGNVKVKASGGIRSFEVCREMFRAGAERIGTCINFFFVLMNSALMSLSNFQVVQCGSHGVCWCCCRPLVLTFIVLQLLESEYDNNGAETEREERGQRRSP